MHVAPTPPTTAIIGSAVLYIVYCFYVLLHYNQSVVLYPFTLHVRTKYSILNSRTPHHTPHARCCFESRALATIHFQYEFQEKSLRVENEQLARNISSLFNTAKAEIARKDKWIEQLRRELREADERRRGKGRFAAPR